LATGETKLAGSICSDGHAANDRCAWIRFANARWTGDANRDESVMAVTYERLVNFLAEELAVDPAELKPTAPLFSTGIIDSFSLISLLTYIETEGGFTIDPADVNLENFDNLERMLKYASRMAA
jgi:acyl carrier protein/D-alanine--poly(phosphoribitol) ligase subunit 2